MLFVLLIIGLLGVLGMTWLFPVLARMLWKWQIGRAAVGVPFGLEKQQPACSLAILLPAHNEEAVLASTLTSILKAIENVQQRYPQLACRLLVGADYCSDATAVVARAAGADVLELKSRHGKWRTIKKLVASCKDFEWIVIADAGAKWHQDLLSKVLPLTGSPEIAGIAPTYNNPDGGLFERSLWAFEKHLKDLESEAGGPVSLHGATVIYRRRELRKALMLLRERDWLNDDVVLPLLVRALNPKKRIVYLSGLQVYDRGTQLVASESGHREFLRRRRMVAGNVQWIRSLFPLLLRVNGVVALLAVRRVFRLFWAYWGMMLALSLLLAVAQLLGGSAAFGMAVFAGLLILIVTMQPATPVGRVLDSAWASLLAPYYLCHARAAEGVVWR